MCHFASSLSWILFNKGLLYSFATMLREDIHLQFLILGNPSFFCNGFFIQSLGALNQFLTTFVFKFLMDLSISAQWTSLVSISKSTFTGELSLVKVTGAAFRRFEKYFCYHLVMSALRLLALPAGHEVNPSLISFTIFQIHLEAACLLVFSNSRTCLSMKRCSSSSKDSCFCFARFFHLSFYYIFLIMGKNNMV